MVLGVLFSFSKDGEHRVLHSFPTRRSSDLSKSTVSIWPNFSLDGFCTANFAMLLARRTWLNLPASAPAAPSHQDRKSTRLNSSHSQISYAVFCLKKKITIITSNVQYASDDI